MQERPLALLGVFLLELLVGRLDQSRGPGTVIQLVRAVRVGGVESVTFLRPLAVEGDMQARAAAFVRPEAVAFVEKEAFHRTEQEPPKPAPLRLHRRQVVLADEPGEEFLRQVPGVLGRKPGASHVGVERILVRAAQLFERRGSLRRRGLPGGQDHAPLRCGKPRGCAIRPNVPKPAWVNE